MTDLLELGLGNAIVAAVLAALVAVPALLLRRRRPAAVHALWLLVLLKLVTPPLWNVRVALPHGEQNARAPEAPSEDVVEYVSAEEFEQLTAARPLAAVPLTDWNRVAVVSAAAAWLAGSAVCLALIVVRTRRFRRLLDHATPVPPEVRRRAQAICRRLGVPRCPAVEFIPGGVCPMLWAFVGRPRLLLPRGLWDRLGDDQRDTLIAHELAHLRRRDHWVRWVEVAATVLYWWNPVLWVARRQLRDAEEQCCDAWVVWSAPSPAGVRHYMTAILEAVEFVSGSGRGDPGGPGGIREPHRGASFAPPAVPALASGMGEFRRLERRLWMIRQNQCARRLGRAGTALVLLCGAAALPLAPTLADDEPTKVEEPRQDVADAKRELRVVTVGPGSGDEKAGDTVVSFAPEGSLFVTTREDTVAEGAADTKGPKKIYDARTSSSIVVDGADMRIVHIASGDEVAQARAEVEQLTAALAQAKARLKDLEKQGKGDGKDPGPKGMIGRRVTVKRGDLGEEVRNYPYTVSKPAKDGGGDQERRIERLEQKLEMLDEVLNELRDLKKQKGDAKDEEKGGKRL